MFGFGGWSFLGNMGFAVRDQGINIILNIFFGVVINAAKGIANQVSGVINGFASNFTMAMNPQITKRYAAHNIEGMTSLIYSGCKYAFILMALIVIPVIISAQTLLKLWLGDIAPYTIIFLNLILIMALIDSVVSPVTTGLLAIGNIKKFQILIFGILIINLPISWILLKLNCPPYSVVLVNIVLSIVALGTRLYLLEQAIDFSIRKFIIRVYARSLPAIAISTVFCYIIYTQLPKNIIGIIVFGTASVSIFTCTIYGIALSKEERKVIIQFIRTKLPIAKLLSRKN